MMGLWGIKATIALNKTPGFGRLKEKLTIPEGQPIVSWLDQLTPEELVALAGICHVQAARLRYVQS